MPTPTAASLHPAVPSPGTARAPADRLGRLDAWRGIAVVWMTAFHFCFDLNFHGFLQQQMLTDPFWTWQRAAIVTVFLFCSGMGQAVALHAGQGWPRFWRRWAQVAVCAALVTAGSYLVFPKTYIGFGVLHGLAVMLVVARLTAGFGAWLWPLGAIALVLPSAALALLPGSPAEPWFNAVPLRALGLITAKPFTEDYVPLFPWLGVMWWGLASGAWLLRQRPQWLAGRISAGRPAGAPARMLAWLGRHSLPWYMLHQPVLMGVVGAWAWLAGR